MFSADENLKTETLTCLQFYGKTPDDIVWIGGRDFSIDIDEFWELVEVEE